MTYGTGNPIGSTDARDLSDNAENMDYLENSTTELTHADRLGILRKTRHGMEVEHDSQIAAHEEEHDAQMQSFEDDFDNRLAGMAFTRVGSFTSGATLTDMRQVLIWEVSQGGDGHEYGWTGTFPKVVAAGATPATSGGIGAGTWVDRTDVTLRSELTAGAIVIRNTLYSFRDFVSVKDFGAAGDGITDDTSSFQSAIDFVISNNKKALYAPAGSYYVPGGLVANGASADAFTLYGDGRRSDIWSDNDVNTLDLVGDTSNTFQYATLDMVALRNTSANGSCLRTRNTELLKIRNCIFSGGLHGIIMSQNANESDIKPSICGCHFAGSQYGIRGGDTRVADAIIRDNTFIDVTSANIEFGYLDGGSVVGNKIFSNNSGGNSVMGINLKRPIYAVIEDNDIFELGGTGIQLTSPRYSRFNNNRLINVGQNAAGSAILIQDFNTSVKGKDIEIIGNTIKDVNGNGITVTSTNSLQSRYRINDNYFENVGDSGVAYDAIALTNCADFELDGNIIDGNSVTRYWLNLNTSYRIKIHDNVHFSCLNADIFRSNSPTVIVQNSDRIITGVTSNLTLNFDDDGVIGGTLTASIYLNLPSASSAPGKKMTFTKTDATAFSLILDPSGSQTINGAATLNVSSQYQTVGIVSDGNNWIKMF